MVHKRRKILRDRQANFGAFRKSALERYKRRIPRILLLNHLTCVAAARRHIIMHQQLGIGFDGQMIDIGGSSVDTKTYHSPAYKAAPSCGLNRSRTTSSTTQRAQGIDEFHVFSCFVWQQVRRFQAGR
ncbi:MAG: hypothetical protein VR74_10605 [Hyphomonas sp. BRH_c22]|nr:MAG: hypothetical protein VR74_10605 [Hyphomonas sp. BRH_c22]